MTNASPLHLIDRLQFPWLTASITTRPIGFRPTELTVNEQKCKQIVILSTTIVNVKKTNFFTKHEDAF